MAAVRAVLLVLLLLAWAVLAIPLGWVSTRLGVRVGAVPQRRFCRALLWALGVRVRRTGDDPGVARLVVANHISWIDVLVLAAEEPLCFLAKREVGTWPLIGTLARGQGTVFVDRRRRRGIPAVNRAMAERLREGRSVLLFPEGTTYDGTRLGRIHTAHLACLRNWLWADPDLCEAPLQSVTLAYSDPVAAWIGDASLVPHLWAVLTRPPITCRLHYERPVTVRAGYDRKVLGRALGADMVAAMAHMATPGTVSRDMAARPDVFATGRPA